MTARPGHHREPDEGAPPPTEVTRLLAAWNGGDEAARDRLLAVVYEELRRRAARSLRGERADHTLQPTALVHEAYLRLVGTDGASFEGRAHFFAVAARAMRHVLVDHAREHRAQKRGGARARVTLEEGLLVARAPRDVDLIALDDALAGLAALDPQQAQIVELRFFGGLSIEEAAEAVGASPATVKRDWSMAKAWLHRRLSGGHG